MKLFASFTSACALSVKGENVIKHHVMQSTGNVQGEFLSLLFIATTLAYENFVGL